VVVEATWPADRGLRSGHAEGADPIAEPRQLGRPVKARRATKERGLEGLVWLFKLRWRVGALGELTWEVAPLVYR
jgi:hypothetical protein